MVKIHRIRQHHPQRYPFKHQNSILCMSRYPTKSQIDVGSTVSIETKENQGSRILTDGTVHEILTSAEFHPHGIKVRLQDGQIGRVKKIIGTAADVVCIPADLDKVWIPKTEDVHNEFKEFFQYDESINRISGGPEKARTVEKIKRSVQERFATAVCSFGNSRDGGIVYLGIKADGTISGLERDRKLDRITDYDDEFANHIRTSLDRFFEDKVFLTSKLRIQFREIDKKYICLVHVLPSEVPIYLKGEKSKMFFVRGFAPRAEKLEYEEQVRYIRTRFPDYK